MIWAELLTRLVGSYNGFYCSFDNFCIAKEMFSNFPSSRAICQRRMCTLWRNYKVGIQYDTQIDFYIAINCSIFFFHLERILEPKSLFNEKSLYATRGLDFNSVIPCSWSHVFKLKLVDYLEKSCLIKQKYKQQW